MTYPTDPNTALEVPDLLLEQIAQSGLEGLPDLIRLLINAAMLLERQHHLGAQPYQRSPERQAHANGFKEKTVHTRLGALTFQVPQVREGGFSPQALEKGIRSERALKLALAEMYVQGVSTRKVAAITQTLCGFEVSSSQVSRATQELDAQLEQWRTRPLGEYRYVYLDAHYEKVRQDGRVQDAAVLLAVGVDQQGHRSVLGVSVSLSEHEVHWRSFLQGLQERGLRGVQLLISDDHAGLKAARKAVFGGVPWQRCQFHLQQNAQAYVPKQELKEEVAASIRAVFNASNGTDARDQLQRVIKQYEQKAPKLSHWLEENLEEGLTVFNYPPSHWRKLRTTNGLERLHREIRRRCRVASLFPSESSCLRLTTAIVMEISEEWETDRIYLTIDS